MSRSVEYSSALFLDTSMPAKQASPDASSGERLTQLVQLLNAMYPKFISSQRRSTNQLAFGVRKLYMLWQLLEGKTKLDAINRASPTMGNFPSASPLYHLHKDLVSQLPPWCTNAKADYPSQQQKTREDMRTLLASIFTSAPGEEQWLKLMKGNIRSDVLHETLLFSAYRFGLEGYTFYKSIRATVGSDFIKSHGMNVSELWGIILSKNTSQQLICLDCLRATCADPQNAEALANMHAVLQKLEELMKILKPLQNSVLHREYGKAIGRGSPSITK